MELEEDDEKVSWSCWLRTLFAASGAMMIFVFTGVTEAQSAVLLPQLKEKDSYIHVTTDEETWIASLGIFAAPISGLIVGPIIDAIGRKKGFLFFYVTMGLGFGIIACATKVWHIYVGRIICAFAVGLEVAAVVYIAEVCTKKQRSLLLSLAGATFTGGVSVTYFVGGYLPWNIASGIFSLACFTYFIVVCFAPESPAWLFKMSKTEACTRSLQRLGRTPSGILRELDLLKLSSKEDSEKFELRAFLEPTVWKPFLILTLFHFLQCTTGVYFILYYTIDFVERLGTTYDPLTVSIVISLARVFTNFTIGFYFTAYVGRKFATTFSAVWMTVAFVGVGIYEYVYREVAATNRPYQWVPVTLLIINIVSGILAVTCLPWVMSGEVFPLRVRGAMTGAVFVMGTAIMFVFIKIYGICVEAVPIWGIFFACAAASFVAVFFGLFLVPETQNKTLYEVEQSFLPEGKRHQNPNSTKQQVSKS